jgi:hypothetical protein
MILLKSFLFLLTLLDFDFEHKLSLSIEQTVCTLYFVYVVFIYIKDVRTQYFLNLADFISLDWFSADYENKGDDQRPRGDRDCTY